MKRMMYKAKVQGGKKKLEEWTETKEMTQPERDG